MLQFIGKVEVHIRDVETLELLDIVKQDNVLTKFFYKKWLSSVISGNNIYISTDNTPHYEDWPLIRNPIIDGFIPAGITSPQMFPAVGEVPSYVQTMRRFNPPTVTRDIYTIALVTPETMTAFNTHPTTAYVSLISPCTQTSTQILDVYYRIQAITSSSYSYNYYNLNAYCILQALFGIDGNSTHTLPNVQGIVPIYGHITSASNTQPIANEALFPNYSCSKNIGFGGTCAIITNMSYGSYTNTWSYITTQGVGHLHGAMSLCNAGTWSMYQVMIRPVMTTMNITAPNGSPIQPIFSHAASTLSSIAANPFLDAVSSSGTGTLNILGNWEPGHLPELYKIDIVTGGAIGTATYKIAVRNHVGFCGESYTSDGNSLAAAYNFTKNGITVSKPHTAPSYAEATYTGSYGVRALRYDDIHMLSYDRTGISIYDITNHNLTMWDSTTTPMLSATDIRQVAVNPGDNSIWIGCANTGIYRINAAGTTITNFTTSNGLPTNNCYALDIGRNNVIWAVCNGGIVKSDNNGASWTTYNNSNSDDNSYFSITTLLLHMNDTNGSTNFTDIKGHSITKIGNPIISTTQSKFGESSAYFDGSSALNITSSPDWNTPSISTDFTIECFVYWTTTPGSDIAIFTLNNINNYPTIIYRTSTNILKCSIQSHGVYITGTTQITNNVWHHIALTKYNGSLSLYLNGISQGAAIASTYNPTNITIGSTNTSTNFMTGYIDEFRMITNYCRYPTNFTPPVNEFLNTQGNILFDHSALNTDWNSVCYIKVDPTNINDRMLIVRHKNCTQNTTITGIWWSVGVPVAISHTGLSPDWRYSSMSIDVSDNDSIWVASSGTYYFLLTYGNSTVPQFGAGFSYSPLFARNDVDTQDVVLNISTLSSVNYPYTLIGTTGSYGNNALPRTITTYNSSGTVISTTTSYMISGRPESTWAYLAWPIYMGNGVLAGYCSDISGSTGMFGVISVISGNGTPSGGAHEYLIWKKYGWNGTNWELNHSGAKPTHSNEQPIIHGLTTKFTNGSTGLSFIAGDYYTCSVNEGILKNNAMIMSGSQTTYVLPTQNLTNFDGLIRTYPWTTGNVVWRKTAASITINNDNSLTNNIPYRSYSMCASSKQRVFGDFSISGTFSTSTTQRYSIGIKYDHIAESPLIQPTVFNNIGFNVLGNAITIVNFSDTTLNTPPAISGTTTWNITRVGNTITFYTAGISRYSTVDTGYSYCIRARFIDTTTGNIPFTINPIIVNSSDPGYYVGLGNGGTGTGIYNTRQHVVFINAPSDILIDDTPLAVLNTSPLLPPPAGGASLASEEGLLFFNSADVGKTVTGSYIMSYQTSTPCNIIPV